MLPQEIIQDVKKTTSHICSKTIDDVIELMTGMKAEDFHKKVDESLEKRPELPKNSPPQIRQINQLTTYIVKTLTMLFQTDYMAII